MLNRFVKLFIKDKQFIVRLVVVVVSIFLFAALFKKDRIQTKEFKKLKEQMQLVTQVSVFEEKLRILEEQKDQEKSRLEKADLVLKGIFIQDAEASALINGEFYREGDSIDGFYVLKVAADSVFLQDKKSNKIVILRL